MNPKVSVIILNWNGAQFLERFLPSVIEHTNKQLAKIVVADNGSTDNSLEILSLKFPQVEVLSFSQNYGFAEGYNQAISKINSEYILLLNSDIEVSPNWLEPLVNRMERNKQVAACVPKLLSINQPESFEYAGAAGGYIDRFGYAFCRGRIFDNLETDNGQYNDARPVFWGTGAALLVRKEIFIKAGALDRLFFAHMEEIDLCWRFWRLGYEVWVEPSSVVYHLGGGTLPQGNPRKTFLNYRNSLLMLLKNLKKTELLWILPFRMILDGISAIKSLTDGNKKDFAAIFKAHLAFYCMIVPTLKLRKQANTLKPLPRGIRYNGCIAFDYFAIKETKFSDIRL
jgi:GT2 family glycosyltransferase